MRTMTILAGVLLAAACHGAPAAAEDSIVDGKPCNALCRSWLGLPAVPSGPVAAAGHEEPVAPPARAPTLKAERKPASPPPLALASGPDPVRNVPAPSTIAGSQAAASRNASSIEAVRESTLPAVEGSPATSEAHDVSTPIVGNPRWKQYADTVFRYQGSLFAADYEKAHPAPPSPSAGLRVSR